MKFYLGTHEQSWIGRKMFADQPLFLSRRRLSRQHTHRKAVTSWALDSGGFSELSMYGMWSVSHVEYIQEVRRWQHDIGKLEWAAIQDWMCEPVITSNTFPMFSHSKAVRYHQALTIESYGQLMALAPDIQWTPVIQGWALKDYMRHVEQYDRSGFDLRQVPVVGVGSVCRRQGTNEATRIFKALSALGLKLHGFGVKINGLEKSASYLHSADSMAWSIAARPKHNKPGIRLLGCDHANCANCAKWALMWTGRIYEAIGRNNFAANHTRRTGQQAPQHDPDGQGRLF